jgi:lipoyl(octanoyl) transferase
MRVLDLGLRAYDEAHRLQKELVVQVQEDPSRGFLVLTEHPAVYTLGRFGSEKNLIADSGIPLRRVERGGDITYHGPGQLVGYVVLDLFRRGLTVRELVAGIEEVLIEVARGAGVAAARREKCPGVWVQDRKLASIGLAISRRVTYHGFALNVNNDLGPFASIHPCGMPGCRITSLSQETGRPIELARVSNQVGAIAGGKIFARRERANPSTRPSGWLRIEGAGI